HGAAWNFIAWGLLYAVFLILEKLWLKKYLDRFRVISHIYVLLITVLGFVLFNAQDMGQAWTDTLALFGGGGYPLVSTESLYYLNSYALLFVIAIIGATPLPKLAVEKIKSTHIGGTVLAVAEPIVTALLLLLVTGYLVDSSFSPFLYFRF
ncbi:MAG: MBOAT family protein, partial [Clostridia bacterium]|nr:MBOAT family protein [Clostridia bacterium]